MNASPFETEAILDRTVVAKTMVDTGCLPYGVVSADFVRKHDIPTIEIPWARGSKSPNNGRDEITHIVRVTLDIDTHSEQNAHFYVLQDCVGYDLILGEAWAVKHDVKIEPARKKLFVRSTGSRIRNLHQTSPRKADIAEVSVAAFRALSRRSNRTKHDQGHNVELFAVTLADIQKALIPKKPANLDEKLPGHYRDLIGLFKPENASELPHFRGEGIDHKIELVQQDGKEPQVPWGPLYNMTKEELVVLRKTLTELLDKGFIRVSHSPAAAPVLFVRKPGGGLRFCVDYRALNAITKKDRYPLPLIHETLNQIGRAKWFTKLDVSAAFHKIRIAEGQEWMTAFRTRYGLFEWQVTPFGLANAPSTFQKYINWALREYLDEICSAYLDDVLVYTDGSLKEHREHVRKVLRKLGDAGLYLDISKCEFEVTTTKYLGYIVRAGEGVSMDPEKVEAIQSWKPPTTVRGVRGFLGFANFYRVFIPDFSKIAMPLQNLTHKDTPFRWTQQCQESFQKLKDLFTTEPVLATFDPDRTTVLETDSSGYNVGGVLSQYDDEGCLRPCAYFSKKNSPAECNYEIYDKELLAIVRCLEEWDAELRSVQDFEIVTDHKNLEYFCKARKLTERHVRWSAFMSKFHFKIRYRKGKDNERADALSRREQDMPDDDDDRVQGRTLQLFRYNSESKQMAILAPILREGSSPDASEQTKLYDDPDNWEQAKREDNIYQEATKYVKDGNRTFPTQLGLKVSIAECHLDDQDNLYFRDRKWVPGSEPLRTNIIQSAHDSLLVGHPGREQTYIVVSREYFWPRMSKDVQRFVRNCDICGRTKPWREQKKGLLKPLPLPDRPWQDITMDFVPDLPSCEGKWNVLVITDRLTKGVIFEAIGTITKEDTAWALIRTVFRRHGLPRTIVSDRGSQFVSEVWRTLCQLCRIDRLLSTAYHPQTDGATERVNSVMEAYIRAYTAYEQDDWVRLLPLAELAINGRTNSSTGTSPFFLSHGYNLSPFEPSRPIQDLAQGSPRSPIQKGEAIVRTIKEGLDWAHASLAWAQQEMEHQANRSRAPAPEYRTGDYVWLKLKNIKTDRPSKKLDWKNAKYQVQEVIGSHAVRLNTPQGIHPVFHVDLIRPAGEDPLPSQRTDDAQPPAILIDDEEEWKIDKIIAEHRTKRGRGTQLRYEVKWTGYARTTREPATALQDTEALDNWEHETAPFRRPDGTLPSDYRTIDEGQQL